MAYKIIGNAISEWDESAPYIFTISAKSGENNDRRQTAIHCDLSVLRPGYSDDFLLCLKEYLCERTHRAALVTIYAEASCLKSLLYSVLDHNLFSKQISVIDDSFLLALSTIKEVVPRVNLETLRRVFNASPHSLVFAPHLSGKDFPQREYKKSPNGLAIERILTKALTRAACIEIIRACEDAYENKTMDIGYFSFINLSFAVYCRPNSYRQIRLDDLIHDTDEDTFYIYIPPAKSRVHAPKKICYRINNRLGRLLQKQRQNVIEGYGHLVDPTDIGKLALFPARRLRVANSGWVSSYANKNFGELTNLAFGRVYFDQIRRAISLNKGTLNANALRHTVGTQLAQSGCSAKTIQAVLKHATTGTAQAYVDIAFNGLMNELSDAMQPAFEAHLPVFQRFRSRADVVAFDKAIYSEEIDSGRIEMTGECGKQIPCQAAPFTCYECNKFIPCWDADHSVNLDIMQDEINKYQNAGAPYRHMVEKAKFIKIRIQLVIAACDRYQQATAELGRGYESSN